MAMKRIEVWCVLGVLLILGLAACGAGDLSQSTSLLNGEQQRIQLEVTADLPQLVASELIASPSISKFGGISYPMPWSFPSPWAYPMPWSSESTIDTASIGDLNKYPMPWSFKMPWYYPMPWSDQIAYFSDSSGETHEMISSGQVGLLITAYNQAGNSLATCITEDNGSCSMALSLSQSEQSLFFQARLENGNLLASFLGVVEITDDLENVSMDMTAGGDFFYQSYRAACRLMTEGSCDTLEALSDFHSIVSPACLVQAIDGLSHSDEFAQSLTGLFVLHSTQLGNSRALDSAPATDLGCALSDGLDCGEGFGDLSTYDVEIEGSLAAKQLSNALEEFLTAECI
jgi:hypothetical protein